MNYTQKLNEILKEIKDNEKLKDITGFPISDEDNKKIAGLRNWH